MNKKQSLARLQPLYNAACWSGTARDKDGKVWNTFSLLNEAKRLGVKLEYPACH